MHHSLDVPVGFLSSVCIQYNTREWKILNIKSLHFSMYENLQFQHSVPEINQAMVHRMAVNFCVGTNFRDVHRNDCFHSRPCVAVWFVLLCLHSTFFDSLDDFSDSCQRHNR